MSITSLFRAATLSLLLAAPLVSIAQAQSANDNTVNGSYYDRHDGQLTQEGTPVPGSAWDLGN